MLERPGVNGSYVLMPEGFVFEFFPGERDRAERRALRQKAVRACRGVRSLYRSGVSFERVLEASAHRCAVSVGDVRGASRRYEVAKARHVAFYLASKGLGMSFCAIGRECGRDHSSVMAAVARIEAQVKTDTELAGVVCDVVERLGKEVGDGTN